MITIIIINIITGYDDYSTYCCVRVSNGTIVKLAIVRGKRATPLVSRKLVGTNGEEKNIDDDVDAV